MQEQRTRGLAAVHKFKAARKRRKLPALSGRVVLWIGIVFLVWGVLYYKYSQSELESEKARVFERQRAIAAEIGPTYEPLRDRIEAWTIEASGPYEGDFIDPRIGDIDFMQAAGVYLRLRIGDATSVEKIRDASQSSLRDGFTACLFRASNPDPTSGPPCQLTRDCEKGLFCSEYDRCTKASQPYNMRSIYRGTRVLSDEWTVDLRTTTNDMRVRYLEGVLDDSANQDVPLAIEALRNAKFFLLVLDEDPAGELAEEADAEAVQAEPHPARVYLYGLEAPNDRLLLRLRRDIAAELLMGAGAAFLDAEAMAAQKRQANGCQLALEVRNAVEGSAPAP